jgi:hypothetical protein
MLERNEKGNLSIEYVSLQIFFGDLFAFCETEKEVEWLEEQIIGIAENMAEERLEDIPTDDY